MTQTEVNCGLVSLDELPRSRESSDWTIGRTYAVNTGKQPGIKVKEP
jgi:hypothetical protein